MKQILFAVFVIALYGCSEKCETCTTNATTYKNNVALTSSQTTTTFEVCDEEDINDYRDKNTTTTWKEGTTNYRIEAHTNCK